MREKISRTSLVVALVVVIWFWLMACHCPGSMVLPYCLAAILTLPSIIAGPMMYRIAGILSLLCAVLLAFDDHASDKKLRDRIRQARSEIQVENRANKTSEPSSQSSQVQR